MRSIKFIVSVLLFAEIYCVSSFEIFLNEEVETRDVPITFSNVEWNCIADANCTTPDSFCTNGKCQCLPHYVFNAAMTSCLRAATKYGDTCDETSQCTAFMLAGGICSRGICICSAGYHYLHDRCYRSSGLGEKCYFDDDCYANFDHAALSCKNQTCACSNGYYQREYRTCRLAAEKPGDECTIDLDCTYGENLRCGENSSCSIEAKNKIGKIALRGSKHQLSMIREVAVTSSTISIKKRCTTDKECEVLGPAICDQATSMCVCKPGNFADSTTLSCVPEIGEKCDKVDVSTIVNATCRFDHWACRGATVSSKDNRVCRQAVTMYEDYCDYDEECYVFGPDASCTENRCLCNDKSHYSDEQKFCWVTKGLKENCKSAEDCYLSDYKSKLVCNNESVCSCPTGTHVNAIGTSCVNDVPRLGEPCSAEIDCKGLNNSMCYHGYCICASYYFASSGKCVNGIDAICKNDDDCKAVDSVCKLTTCSCKDSYVAIDIAFCLPVAPMEGDCRYDRQCLSNTTNSRCDITGKCTCQYDYRYNKGKCYKIKNYGDKCDDLVDECWDNDRPNAMSCNNHYCDCNKGFRPSYDWKYCAPDNSSKASYSNNEFAGWIWLTIFASRFIHETIL